MLVNKSIYKNMLSGKTAIVTGANEGMGFQTALALAYRNCRVIMACKRDCTAQREHIIKDTGNKNVISKYINLLSLTSVRHFAQDIIESEKRLDILVNNAGVYCCKEHKTEDGLHGTMQTNHFGPFLLTYLLSGFLKQSAPSRIVFVASSVSFYNNLTAENLNNPSPEFREMLTYGNSKLCNIITAKLFARKLEPFNVTCNSLHPGLIQTRFLVKFVENSSLTAPLAPVFSRCVRLGTQDIDYGSKGIIFLAADPALQNVSGKYFFNLMEHEPPPKAHDEVLCKKIWENSEHLVKLSTAEREILEAGNVISDLKQHSYIL